MDTCKPAKDGNGYILRLFNYQEVPVKAGIDIEALHLKAEVSFEPSEIKTVRVFDGGYQEVNLITEEP